MTTGGDAVLSPSPKNTWTLALAGLVSALLLLVLVLAIKVLYLRHQALAPANQTVPGGDVAFMTENLVAEQQRKLHVPEVLDPEKHVVRVPIGRAMEIVVQELRAGKSPSEIVVSLKGVDRGRGEGPPPVHVEGNTKSESGGRPDAVQAD